MICTPVRSVAGVVGYDLLHALHRGQQGHAAAGHDALFNSRAGSSQRVFDAQLALLHFDFGGRAYLDDSYAAGQLGQTLLQLFAVIIRGGLGDLRADLRHAGVDIALFAGAFHDGGVFLVNLDQARLTQHIHGGVLAAPGRFPR